MESPASWKTAELIIGDALNDRALDRANGTITIGASIQHVIAERLREAGLINDDDEPEIGWAKLREHRARQKDERRKG